jgi:hypothetical protein
MPLDAASECHLAELLDERVIATEVDVILWRG